MSAVIESTPKSKKKPKPQPHGKLRVWDLAQFFGKTWGQMEKDLQASSVDIRNVEEVLKFVAQRILDPFLKTS